MPRRVAHNHRFMPAGEDAQRRVRRKWSGGAAPRRKSTRRRPGASTPVGLGRRSSSPGAGRRTEDGSPCVARRSSSVRPPQCSGWPAKKRADSPAIVSTSRCASTVPLATRGLSSTFGRPRSGLSPAGGSLGNTWSAAHRGRAVPKCTASRPLRAAIARIVSHSAPRGGQKSLASTSERPTRSEAGLSSRSLSKTIASEPRSSRSLVGGGNAVAASVPRYPQARCSCSCLPSFSLWRRVPAPGAARGTGAWRGRRSAYCSPPSCCSAWRGAWRSGRRRPRGTPPAVYVR